MQRSHVQFDPVQNHIPDSFFMSDPFQSHTQQQHRPPPPPLPLHNHQQRTPQLAADPPPSANSASALSDRDNSNDQDQDDNQNDQDGDAAGSKKKRRGTRRRKVNHACVYCRRSHMTCDDGRPCQRCIKREIGHLCHDEARPPHNGNNSPDMQESQASSSSVTNQTPNLDLIANMQYASPLLQQGRQSSQNWQQQPTNTNTSQESFYFPESALDFDLTGANGRGQSEFSFLTEFLNGWDDRSFFNPPNTLSSTIVPTAQQQQPTAPQLPLSPASQMMQQQQQQQQQQQMMQSAADVDMNQGMGGMGPPGMQQSLQSNQQQQQQQQQQMLNQLNQSQSQPPSTNHNQLSNNNSNSNNHNHPNNNPNNPNNSSTSNNNNNNNNNNNTATPAPPIIPAANKTERYLLISADQATGTRDERLKAVIRAKFEAGLLRPYNYVKGYARLSRWMDRNVSPESKQQILQPLSVLRPKFRAVAQSLKDINLVFIEEAFERLLLDYDRVFSAMSIPACLWRRTGEIYKGNREFAELVGIDDYMLRDGRLCIYELMAEESAVNYWEKYGHVAFDTEQTTVMTSCVLRYKLRYSMSSTGQGTPVNGRLSMNKAGVGVGGRDGGGGASGSGSGGGGSGVGSSPLSKGRTQSGVNGTSGPGSHSNSGSGSGGGVTGTGVNGTSSHGVGVGAGVGQFQTQGEAQEEGFVNCCFSFTVRRDEYGTPSMIVGNFIKC